MFPSLLIYPVEDQRNQHYVAATCNVAFFLPNVQINSDNTLLCMLRVSIYLWLSSSIFSTCDWRNVAHVLENHKLRRAC